MKKYCFTFFLFYTGILFSQTTFQTHFHSCEGGVATYASETEEGYFILGTTGGWGCISFTLLDSTGHLLRTNELYLNSAGIRAWDQALIQDENGDFLILCEIVDTIYRIVDPYLIKVSGESLDTLWTKRYRTDESERCRSIQKYKEGYLLLAETTYITRTSPNSVHADSSHLLFIHVDTIGTILKQIAIKDTFNICQPRNFGVVQNDELAVVYDAGRDYLRVNGYVALIDTAFNFKWTRKLDEIRYAHDLPTLLISNERDRIFVNFKAHKIFPDIGVAGSGNVAAYNLFGDLHWVTELYGGGIFDINFGDIASNNDVINCGYDERGSIGDGKDHARLFRLSPNGKIIWDRIYSVLDTWIDYSSFYYAMETTDGGILATGYVLNTNFNDYEMYVLKVDANGCLTPNCDSIVVPFPRTIPTNINELKPNHYLVAFPNPANDNVNFSLKENQRFLKGTALIINDLSGRKIKEFLPEQNTNTVSWNTENQLPGVYFYRLFSEGGVIESGKIILQK